MGKELDIFNGNSEENVPESGAKSLSVEGGLAAVPAIVMVGGERSAYRFLEFFAANIRNLNTRLAYYHAVCEFFAWCEARRVRELSDIRSHHVAGYIEALTKTYAAPSVKGV
jgi:hypothetical protein